MRPTRLELEGFTAFRDRTVVDLDGVDLFALCGPTGAGKSSVIDAITFALYGSVPRLDVGSVAPVVAQNGLEARVRLDFTVGDDAYVAVRVVRVTKAGGATTKEARLEAAGGAGVAADTVLAADAKGMTTAVTSLLGLDFRQFTTCVSLPQGDFARFLHAEPRHRQDLLVRLLDLGLFERVAQAARQRERLGADRAAVAEGQLTKLEFATEEALAAAERRVADLTGLRDEVDAAAPELDRLREAARAADDAATSAGAAVALVGGVVVPDGIEGVAGTVALAVAARTTASAAEEAADAAVGEAEAALAAKPPRAELEATARDHLEVERLRGLAAKGTAAVAAATEAARDAGDVLARAKGGVAEAAAALHGQRTTHLAHALAAEVVVGEPCPVCRRPITDPPAVAPADVTAAEKAHAAAARAADDAAAAASAAAAEQARVEAKLAGVAEQLDAVTARLERAATAEETVAALAAVAEAEERLRAARDAAAAARQDRIAAAARADAAAAAADGARRAFDAARDRVAVLGPPAADRADLLDDWRALAAWAAARHPELRRQRDEHQAMADAARSALASRADGIAQRCAGVGVDAGERPRDAVVDALAAAEADRRRVADALTEAAGLRSDVAAARDAAAVAGVVAHHLRADGFERWLLEEALRELVTGATVLLRELSGGAYSLTLDERSRAFGVVDHVNADTVRSARTLSGGETFLASLALALALADQVAASAAGAARLETILLDEGFGTLDPETLDTVAAALEELGARGRMVGVVTHVRELAERLPVRFELRKVGGAATIERIDA
jgi:exonuclease SbcC